MLDTKGLKIVLGSVSPARKKILHDMGYEFEVMASNIDEKAIRADDPKELVTQLSYAKAEALLSRITEPALLITSDQVIFCNGRIHEKPQSASEAREYLEMYEKNPPETVAGVVVTNTLKKKQVHGVDVCAVFFSTIPEDVIERTIQSKEVFKHAGGFDIADPLIASCIKEIKGERESILGLPRLLTEQLMKGVL